MLVYGSHPTHNCSSSSFSIISMRVIIVIFGLFIVNPKLLALSQRSPSTSPCCSERIHFTSPQVALTFREKKSRGIDRHPFFVISTVHSTFRGLCTVFILSNVQSPPNCSSFGGFDSVHIHSNASSFSFQRLPTTLTHPNKTL